jgi:hypothetical protein
MRGKPGDRDREVSPSKAPGPGGAAKKRIGEKESQQSALRLEDWSKFKAQMALNRQADDYPVGWAGDPKDLKRRQALWAERAAGPDQEKDEEMDVADTNVPAWKQASAPRRRPLRPSKLSSLSLRRPRARERLAPSHVRGRTAGDPRASMRPADWHSRHPRRLACLSGGRGRRSGRTQRVRARLRQASAGVR